MHGRANVKFGTVILQVSLITGCEKACYSHLSENISCGRWMEKITEISGSVTICNLRSS